MLYGRASCSMAAYYVLFSNDCNHIMFVHVAQVLRVLASSDKLSTLRSTDNIIDLSHSLNVQLCYFQHGVQSTTVSFWYWSGRRLQRWWSTENVRPTGWRSFSNYGIQLWADAKPDAATAIKRVRGRWISTW